MSEFYDTSTEFRETEEISDEIETGNEWSAFDEDISMSHDPETGSFDLVAMEDGHTGGNALWGRGSGEDLELSEADKAAEYARSLGFDRAGDYIARHFDGEAFVPGHPIPIRTRNMALEGQRSENGILFTRRTAELADGLSVEGVFPEFDSNHHVELGIAANDMTLHRQFSACKADFQDHMYDSPEKLQGITFGAMERMDSPQGYTPEGFTWQHNPETGSYDLVSTAAHSVGHTGGNALWGIY